MKLLNLGCGSQIHGDWLNIDFVSTSKEVMSWDLLEGIPFPDNDIDFLYHSHLLEHFSKSDGKAFMKECFRVLKPGGVIRVVVPDLETIAKNYLVSLEGALKDDIESVNNYEWIMLEMYDQIIRNKSGGEMAEFLSSGNIPNKAYVYGRIGDVAMNLNEEYLQSKVKTDKPHKLKAKSVIKNTISTLLIKTKILNIRSFSGIAKVVKRYYETYRIGRFRLSGEVHQWMYDRYSLCCSLKESGFSEIRIVSAFESRIPDWENYQLDTRDTVIRKPDSLFIEAIK